MKKTIFLIAIAVLMMSIDATAEEFQQLSGAGASGKQVVQESIKAWMWGAALIPLAFAGFLFSKVKEYQERQEEQGQYQPKVSKYAGLVGAIVGGVLIVYVAYGVIGAVFFDKTFTEMWNALVVDFFQSLIG